MKAEVIMPLITELPINEKRRLLEWFKDEIDEIDEKPIENNPVFRKRLIKHIEKSKTKKINSLSPLNITGKEFCKAVGLTYNGDILKELRNLQIISFFKVGKKYMYPSEDVKKVSDKLRKGEISIKTNNGYYITLNA